jgi:protein-L-isoaspartate O-methyltransferase
MPDALATIGPETKPAPVKPTRAELEAAWGRLMAKKPANAVALIVAELKQDESDSMTDYFGSKTLRLVAIGWRTGKREDFRQLRKAAATFPQTAHLGPECDRFEVVAKWTRDGDTTHQQYAGRYYPVAGSLHGKHFAREVEAQQAIEADKTTLPDGVAWTISRDNIEHRENYSMGAGNYLKSGSRDADGWSVHSMRPEFDGWREIEDALPDAAAASKPGTHTVTATGTTGPGAYYTVQKHWHTKRAVDFWLVVLESRVGADEFDRLRGSCELAGGYYSRKWGTTPGGFAFDTEAAAVKWAGEVFACGCNVVATGPEAVNPCNVCAADDKPTPKPAHTATTSDGAIRAARFRDLAETLTPKIENLQRDRLSNTPKRQCQAMGARCEAENLERVQRALLALAEGWEAGTVPHGLRELRTRKDVEPLATRVIEHPSYYVIHTSDKWTRDTPQAVALREFVAKVEGDRHAADDAAEAKARDIKRREDAIKFVPIPGFFPTPPDVVAIMLDAADIRPGMNVLEPSAGKGDIADAIAARHKVAEDQSELGDGIRLTCLEIVHTLADLVRAKGHDSVCTDYLQTKADGFWDRVVMNPPFEKGAAYKHLRHAYDDLAPGGRVVCLMPSPYDYRNLRQARTEAHEWLAEVGAEFLDVPAGSFSDAFRSTGVSVVVVVIDKN